MKIDISFLITILSLLFAFTSFLLKHLFTKLINSIDKLDSSIERIFQTINELENRIIVIETENKLLKIKKE